MNTLTVHQPWAWLIVHGGKWIENRTWRVDYRGRLAIHAGRSRSRLEDWYLPDGRPAIISPYLLRPLPQRQELVFGAVIGTVDLVDCVRSDDDRVARSDRGGRSPWNDGTGWCWILRQARPIEPVVYCPGRQRLFDVEIEG